MRSGFYFEIFAKLNPCIQHVWAAATCVHPAMRPAFFSFTWVAIGAGFRQAMFLWSFSSVPVQAGNVLSDTFSSSIQALPKVNEPWSVKVQKRIRSDFWDKMMALCYQCVRARFCLRGGWELRSMFGTQLSKQDVETCNQCFSNQGLSWRYHVFWWSNDKLMCI